MYFIRLPPRVYRATPRQIDTLSQKIYNRRMPPDVPTVVEAVYRSEWGRVVATLIGMVGGDFDLAEEAAQEAFAAAIVQWQQTGVPEYLRAWIIATARHKAIDRIRRKSRFEEELEPRLDQGTLDVATDPDVYTGEIPDDRLSLIFTCCHPALA